MTLGFMGLGEDKDDDHEDNGEGEDFDRLGDVDFQFSVVEVFHVGIV